MATSRDICRLAKAVLCGSTHTGMGILPKIMQTMRHLSWGPCAAGAGNNIMCMSCTFTCIKVQTTVFPRILEACMLSWMFGFMLVCSLGHCGQATLVPGVWLALHCCVLHARNFAAFRVSIFWLSMTYPAAIPQV